MGLFAEQASQVAARGSLMRVHAWHCQLPCVLAAASATAAASGGTYLRMIPPFLTTTSGRKGCRGLQLSVTGLDSGVHTRHVLSVLAAARDPICPHHITGRESMPSHCLSVTCPDSVAITNIVKFWVLAAAAYLYILCPYSTGVVRLP